MSTPDAEFTPLELGIGVATGRFTVAEAAALMPKEPEDLQEPDVIDLTKAEPIDVTGVVENGKIAELNTHIQNLVDAGNKMAKELTETRRNLQIEASENSKFKRLLSDLMGKADFDHDGDTILIYHNNQKNGDIAYKAMEEFGGIFCEKWAKENARWEAHKKAQEKEAELKAEREEKKAKKARKE